MHSQRPAPWPAGRSPQAAVWGCDRRREPTQCYAKRDHRSCPAAGPAERSRKVVADFNSLGLTLAGIRCNAAAPAPWAAPLRGRCRSGIQHGSSRTPPES
jgi:hypothetical protein